MSTLEIQIQNLQNDIAIFQNYMKLRTSNSEVPALLEDLIRNIFDVIIPGNFANLNRIRVNFPAIDLADRKSKTAVQVTINATKLKITKTIAAFQENELNKDYSQLYIFGNKIDKKTTVPTWCHLWDFTDVIAELRESTKRNAVESITEALRRHVDYGKLHPMDDTACLKIILNCINRSAIKHGRHCEASYGQMVVGLDEITEVISKGTINGREMSKHIGQFQNPQICDFLNSAKNSISLIKAIINKSSKGKTDGYVALNMKEMEDIDQIKESIVTETNTISKKFKLGISLHMQH